MGKSIGRDKKNQGSDVHTVLENITGIILDEGKSLDDYRLERLEKKNGIRLTDIENQRLELHV